MKNKNILFSVLVLLSSLGLSGCNDFLTVTSDSQNISSNTFKTYSDLRAATGYLYAMPWYDFNNNAPSVIETRANNLSGTGTTSTTAIFSTFSETGGINQLLYIWRSLYNVITQSDYVINDYVPITRKYVDSVKVNACEGEARFMRGTAYWYLAMLWHDVPIIDKPAEYTKDYRVNVVQFEDVLQYAINDLTYSATNLPTTDDAGRVTKYSAEGMLARLYLTAADYAMGNHFSSDYLARNNAASNEELAQLYFSKVKTLTDDIIVNGTQYGLMDDYEELFRVQNNNNKESLFSLQFVPASTVSGLGNGVFSSFSYSTSLTGGLSAYGGVTYCSYDIAHLSALDKGMSRTRANIFVNKQTYSYLSYLATTGYGGTKCNVKKQVVGSSADTGGKAINGNSGLMTPLLRMADVYLMYTEACVGTGIQTNDATAVKRFNDVRKRAFYYYTKNNLTSPYWTHSVVTRNDLFKERRLEFFMENIFWQDIVRRSFYDLDWVTKYLNNKLYQPSGYTLTTSGGTLVTSSSQYSISDTTTVFTNFSWFAYTYDPTSSSNNSRLGFSSNSPRLDATFTYFGTAYHNVQAGSYVHAPLSDNIWALPYPTSEVTMNLLLIEKPVKYNF